MRWAAGVTVLLLLVAGGVEAAPVALDAREAGALGDGVADDGPALQRALEALGAAGGTLTLPAGEYALGRPLDVHGAGVRIMGAGAVLRPLETFDAGRGPAALIRTRPGADPVHDLTVEGLTLDGGGVVVAGIWLERVRRARVRDNLVRGVRDGDGGAIVVRSTSPGRSPADAGEITVSDNEIVLEAAVPGIALRRVVNCRVADNRVQGDGTEGGHGIDVTGSQGCTITGNTLLGVDVGLLADETNHLQVIGNYAFAPRIGFRAGRRPDGNRPAANNVFVDNRVLTGGAGFDVRGSGMMLVGNYAAFLSPGPAIWVREGGTHDAVVANNASVAKGGGIRFDASDGVIVGNVPTGNPTRGIEVHGSRVAVSANAVNGSPIGIALGPKAVACSVVGNTVHGAEKAPLVLEGRGHRVRDNVGPEEPLPEMGPGAFYGSGEVEVRAARTEVEAAFADDRYLVAIEWAADPGAREWIAEKRATGFAVVLPGPPPAPVRLRWIARGH